MRRRSLLAAPLALLAAPPGVDLFLVLAVDCSGSVDTDRFAQQRQGYADAFRNPRVLAAIAGGKLGAIAVTMLQWAGEGEQEQVVGWQVVRDAGSAQILAAAILAAERALYGGGTSISDAIDTALTLFPAAAAASPRVIDISGDGANNRGRPVGVARAAALAHGVTINGLPILAVEANLDDYYRNHVIGGRNAFVIPAASYDSFAQAILQKLINEIA